MRCIILLCLSFTSSAAAVAAAAAVAFPAAAGVAAAFGEGAAEASAGGVAAARCWRVRAAADLATESVAAPSSVVIVVGEEEREEAPVAVGALLGLVGLVLAEAVVDDVVVLVDAALHLGTAAAGEKRECGGGQEWCGDLG
jgi:hypothetical protein